MNARPALVLLTALLVATGSGALYDGASGATRGS
jgi:hypothetical protein